MTSDDEAVPDDATDDATDGAADAVTLSGRLDARHAAQTRAALQARVEAGDADVVVDLTEVESIDATVMAVLGATAVRLRRAGRHLVLRGCAPALRRLFACRGWRRLFVWERDRQDADARHA